MTSHVKTFLRNAGMPSKRTASTDEKLIAKPFETDARMKKIFAWMQSNRYTTTIDSQIDNGSQIDTRQNF